MLIVYLLAKGPQPSVLLIILSICVDIFGTSEGLVGYGG